MATKTTESAARFLAMLAGRWADEHKYEDFKEYKKAMEKNLPAGAKLISMTKRPFDVVYELGNKRHFMTVKRGKIECGHF